MTQRENDTMHDLKNSSKGAKASVWSGFWKMPCRRGRIGVLVAGSLGLLFAVAARGQVVESANAGRLNISAGGTASGYYVQYGERKMLGITGFVDLDARSPWGIEAEGRWLEWRQTANVHAETYSIGPRYHKNMGKFQPYVKGMIGFGNFNFPYNLAHGRYLVATGGGGVDYQISPRVHFRAVDVEYQYWPEFTFGAMTTFGISSGIRVRIF
jgi:hypothetical protein